MLDGEDKKQQSKYDHDASMGALKNTYKMGEETLQNQRNVLENLQAQSETLSNIEKTQARIDSNLSKGDKIVKQMTTWKGWFSSMVSGNNSKAEKKK